MVQTRRVAYSVKMRFQDMAGSPPLGEVTEMMQHTKRAGDAVTRIVGRCRDAQDTTELDLSECLLTQVPEAVFHLMRHTSLSRCDLSFNVMTKIPSKLAISFGAITDLNLSHNRMTKLPDEIMQLSCLVQLDLSHNSFSNLPYAVFGLPAIVCINAENNQISDVEVGRLSSVDTLREVNLCDNPLTRYCRKSVMENQKVTLNIVIGEEKLEEWEKDFNDSE